VSYNGSLTCMCQRLSLTAEALRDPRLTSDGAPNHDGVDLMGECSGRIQERFKHASPPPFRSLKIDAHILTVRDRLNGHRSAEINGLVHSAKRRKLVSAHVHLHYNRVIPGFM